MNNSPKAIGVHIAIHMIPSIANIKRTNTIIDIVRAEIENAVVLEIL